MANSSKATALCAASHDCALFLTYGFFTLKALLEFNPQWDYLAYHLPDALAWFKLTTYQPEPFLQRINAAWPPLAHLVQGALVFLTGRLSTANGANAVLFVAIVLMLRSLLGSLISWRWFLTTLLAVPLFMFHFVSGYTDLFANLWVLLAWGALLSLELQQTPARRGESLGALCLGIAGAALTKLQMWPAVGVIVVYSVLRLPRLNALGASSRKATLLILTLLVVTAATWPVRNLIVYQNPTYPVRFPLAPKFFPNYSRLESTARDTPAYLRENAAPTAFLHSVLELNRLKSAEPYRWWLDQSAADGEQSPHHRMGGWNYVTVILMLACWGISIRKKLLPVAPTVLFFALGVTIAFIPQSHELRYWLFIPLVSALVVGRVLASGSFRYLLPLKLLLLLAAAYVVGTTDLLSLDLREAATYAPAEAVSFWEEQKVNADKVPRTICGKMPNTVFWAGPTFNEFPVRACAEKR